MLEKEEVLKRNPLRKIPQKIKVFFMDFAVFEAMKITGITENVFW